MAGWCTSLAIIQAPQTHMAVMKQAADRWVSSTQQLHLKIEQTFNPP